MSADPQKPRKFNPAKVKAYTVIRTYYLHMYYTTIYYTLLRTYVHLSALWCVHIWTIVSTVHCDTNDTRIRTHVDTYVGSTYSVETALSIHCGYVRELTYITTYVCMYVCMYVIHASVLVHTRTYVHSLQTTQYSAVASMPAPQHVASSLVHWGTLQLWSVVCRDWTWSTGCRPGLPGRAASAR